MNVSILPKVALGRWSLGLTIVFALVLVLAQVPTGFNGFPQGINPVLRGMLLFVLIGASGAAVVTGLIAAVKNRERSILVFVGIAFSLWVGVIGAVGYFLI